MIKRELPRSTSPICLGSLAVAQCTVVSHLHAHVHGHRARQPMRIRCRAQEMTTCIRIRSDLRTLGTR